ncbi:FAD dependent pyridine nucleotide-disulfide oxidoreductase/ferredoxin reductase [Acidisphaera rubrifaciens HS-AP3]|uniref:FAD dependent pyridine nucleotide-disulfide oxidoreductase/ferredoxin reductase n=1 Tax=Acidisphaera rubrifaciens HS-AP3 TaxID=1231350 RepID=A0A0D6P324_9PROT|nr:FAD dependent pyridine nucleotide-disulfide oxidoreductase/ferredoxin reductase [Acidisphaera rubrifaciens HS-AP3]
MLIVGAGQAGATAAALLRQYGWTGSITLVGAEAASPYQRPPLSKAWLAGTATDADLRLRAPGFYAEQRIDLRTGVRVEAIDRAGRAAILADGTRLPYDRLILATGCAPRRLALPGMDLPGVLELRTQDDATRLRAALSPGARLAVIGGGYVGLEVAATAVRLGLAVTVIEREARLLARVASPELAAYIHAAHAAAGVAIRLSADVASLDGAGLDGAALDGAGDRVAGVRLGDGTVVACDATLVGVGAVPCDALARGCDLACDNGIVVDAACRTDDPAIQAIGDCTRRPLPLYATTGRLESVPNATEQAKQAAAALCGRPPPPPEVPWFWSDQYDLRIQIAGLPVGAVPRIVRQTAGAFSVAHLDAGDRLVTIETVNAVTDFAAGRMIIGRRRRLDPARLADPACPLAQTMLPE